MKKKSNLDNLIKKYEEEIPLELVEAIKNYQDQMNLLKEENTKNEIEYLKKEKEYQKTIENHNLIKGMVLHDLRGPLGRITQANELLENKLYSSEEEKNWLHEQIEKNSRRSLNIANIINLSNLKKVDLKKNREYFSLEEIAKENASSVTKDLSENNLILNLKYNQNYEKPIQIYSNKDAFFTIWSTLSGNSLNYAPENTRIKQGIRLNNSGNLEIIMENKTDGNEKRKLEGLGKGYGFKFVKEIIKELGGRIEKYDKQIIDKTYQVSQKFGNQYNSKEVKDNYGDFSIKITIPISELSEEE